MASNSRVPPPPSAVTALAYRRRRLAGGRAHYRARPATTQNRATR
jgi:hypothetical protein